MQAKFFPTYKNEYTVFTKYERSKAKDNWIKDNLGNTKTRNYAVFDGRKVGIPPNDGFYALQPPATNIKR